MQLVRQLAPLAALFAVFGLLGIGATPAFGNVSSISPVSNGNTITITASYTNNPAGTGASVSAAGNGSFSAANATGGLGVQASGLGTKEIKVTGDTSGNTGNVITVTATFACQGNGPVSFLLLQVGGQPNNQSASANCAGTSSTGNNTSGVISVTPNSQNVGQSVNVQAACQVGSVLSAAPSIGSFSTATLSGAAINTGGNSVTCSSAGQLSATYNCTSQGATTFTLSGATGASAALTCGAVTNAQTSGPGGTNTGLTLANPNNAGRNSPVSITVSPDVIPCGGTASVTVTSSLIANAPVQDGTVVNLYTTNGIVEPKNGVIKDGKFITTLKAPTTAGSATVNASVGSVTNYMDVRFDCGLSAATTGSFPNVANTPVAQPLTASPPPPPPPPPAGSFPTAAGAAPIIAPPNTGDAGLKALAID
jgi:adhesin/invasin